MHALLKDIDIQSLSKCAISPGYLVESMSFTLSTSHSRRVFITLKKRINQNDNRNGKIDTKMKILGKIIYPKPPKIKQKVTFPTKVL